MRVLVFGDSIAYGSWDSRGGWADRLKRCAHSLTLQSDGNPKTQVLNLSVPGDTSTKILRRLDQEITVRQHPDWQLGLIFAFGTNDSREKNGKPETPLKQFDQTIEKIIAYVKKYNYPVLFVGPPPLQQPNVVLSSQTYIDERIMEYDAVLQHISESAEMPYVSTRHIFEQAGVSELFCFDKLHPNENGHALIFRQVVPKVEEMIGLKMPLDLV